jgi:ElaB/YqjD/DUF883 family membrane-anchored ribosome-binding protein
MTTDAQRDGMIADAKSLIGDADGIVESMASASGEKLGALGEKVRATLRLSKEKMTDAQQALAERAKATAQATDNYVRENPWQVIGVATALGVALGLLINRK